MKPLLVHRHSWVALFRGALEERFSDSAITDFLVSGITRKVKCRG